MSKSLHRNNILLKPAISLSLFCLFLTGFSRNQKTEGIKEVTLSPGFTKIIINKFSEKRRFKIRLYPDASRQTLLITTSGPVGNKCHFFMFDMEGKLINEADLCARETSITKKLTTGKYLFEIFCDDQRIENGTLTVK